MREAIALILIVAAVLFIVQLKPAQTVDRPYVVEKPVIREVPKEVPKIIEKEVPVYIPWPPAPKPP